MDRTSLRSVENKEGLPDYLKQQDNDVAALLLETSAIESNELFSNIDKMPYTFPLRL